ncbi:Peroxin 19 [Penicillium digitatum]|uniref:Peroxin 19 n=3 Tax=Penicillium digitatum TaxID=36651 RepID=K9FK85_PEND2|nr:Peroxin 19 [Penicillium digitatum Pd1]EKV07303.1 Peroxin 19 [Penicillium digitatum Pd1]EKV08667.1 Peroxin 19 [Penicillium digitatum PHI26]QQK41128.1 Peroxin 19 [Penicillium digitatum]
MVNPLPTEDRHEEAPTVTGSTAQESQPAPNTDAAPAPAPAQSQNASGDDEDSDFDELDDVLDDFNKPKPAPPANPPALSATNSDPLTGIAPPDFDEDAFLKQLEQDMANMIGPGGDANGSLDPKFQATVDQGAEVLAKQLEESGIPPGDFLKQLLADVMAEGDSGAGASAENLAAAAAGISAPSTQGSSSTPNAGAEQPVDSFNDAIKRTMGRMKESGDKATAAINEDDISEDMLAQLLKAVEAGASGAGEDGDLSKMFMGMMEQLSNKEMLYEPMKELDVKFGPWIEKNKGSGKVSAEDMQRFETQARVVKQIVAKFEEKNFSDDDPKCREYVWERMQEMQAAGSPPEELVSNPLMEDLEGAVGAGGVPDCPQQ